MSNVDEFLDEHSSGSGAPGVTFTAIGQKVVGKLTANPKRQETQYGPRLVIEMTVISGDAMKGVRGADGQVQPGDEVSLWIKPGAMTSALKQALQASGAKLAEGDTLAYKFTEEGTPKQAGWNPPKFYAAEHQPAKPGIDADSLI